MRDLFHSDEDYLMQQKNSTIKNSAYSTNILTQYTSRENNKNNENHQTSILFDTFIDT